MATFGQRLKDLRTASNMSQSDLANRIGTTKQAISHYENDKRRPDYEILADFSKIFHVTADYLLGKVDDFIPIYENTAPLQTKRFPVLGSIACGEPVFMNEERNLYVEADSSIRADFVLYARGDSMKDARILDGDIVFIRSQPTVENGQIAAIAVGDEATLKRFIAYPDKNMVILRAANSAYNDMIYIGSEIADIHILGLAVAFQSDIK